MAECHPVGFQWVMEAKRRGATIIHVDPRFTRTSALADLYVPLRAGTDIAFLGGLIHHVLQTDAYFHDYVLNYTNANVIIEEGFEDTEDLAGMFSGWDEDTGEYDPTSWQYLGADMPPAAGKREQFAGEPKASAAPRSPTARPTTPSPIPVACSRSSSATSRATRPRWSPRSAASTRTPSSRSPRR
jgi:formate dehydrogenase major subunit